MSTNIDLLEKILIYTLNNDLLANIFKDLIWGIIRFKEENWEDSSERLRGFIEHSHKILYEKLINLTSHPIYLKDYQKSAKKLYKKLRWYIFRDLSINETTLLEETRQIYEYFASHFHEIISNANKSKSLPIIINCIKLMLLTEEIIFLIEHKLKNELKLIDIDKKHKYLLSLNDFDIIETLFDIIFSRKLRDLLFQKYILDLNDISNSKVLQEYLPFYIFNHLRIENLLSETKIYPFRAVGPHLIDFEQGNWVYIPKNAKFIKKQLEITKKSVLISALSGTGKTVISRWIGYSYYKNGFNVFYIDCLELNAIKIETILDQIIILNKKNPSNILFIFENIHILDDDLKNKLVKCKDNTQCLFTERIFEEKQEGRGEFRQKFKEHQKIQLSMNHWSYKKTIKGIINLNSKNKKIINQLRNIGNQNLWIYAIILKLFKESSDSDNNTSLITILTDHQLIGEKLSDYFTNLLKTKVIKLLSSEDALYLNHLLYFLGILSIFSEYELWIESEFIDYIISINDESAIGILNSKIKVNKEVIKEIQSFLLNIFEINERKVDVQPGIRDKEYLIPHSQMATIYKNCILKLYEYTLPGLIDQLMYLYVSYGKYYGSFLFKKQQYQIINRDSRNLNGKYRNFFDFQSYFKFINYDKSIKIIQTQFLKNPIEENEKFLFCVNLYSNLKKNQLQNKVFQDVQLLFNPFWKFKIKESNPERVFYFLDRLYRCLENNVFIEFIKLFKDTIFTKFKEDTGENAFAFLNLLLKVNERRLIYSLESLSKLFDGLKIKTENLFSIYIRNKEFFKVLKYDHPFYTIVKKVITELILKLKFEEESQLVRSPYFNYGDLFSQIYYDVLEELLIHDDQTLSKIYEIKLYKTNLINIIFHLKDLYKENSSIAICFFKRFLEIIKLKLYEADVDNIETFFDILSSFFKVEKEFIKNSFLSDWEWFKGIFLRLSDSEFFYFSRFRIIHYFFEDIFPKDLEKFKEFFKLQSILRIQDYYDTLECKIDIVDKLTINLKDRTNDFILNLFNKAIYDSLKVQDLPFYTNYFKKLQVSRFLNKKWDFKKFVLSNVFKEKLMQARDGELKDFFIIFWKGEPWREILFDIYKDLLTNRFGKDYEHILKLENDFEERLRMIVNNLELIEIIKHYNYYNDPFFGKKKSYVFSQLRKIIQENYNKFLDTEFKNKLNSLNFSIIFNLLIIFREYHPSIINEFCNRNKSIILEKFNKSKDFIEIIFILEYYNLTLNILKELDVAINGEISIYNSVLETLKKIDLASLRYLIQINPAEILNDYIEIEFLNHLEYSSLLQLSIFLYKPELSIALKIPSMGYIRKISFMGKPVQKSPFILELSEEDLKKIKESIESILLLNDRFQRSKRERIYYASHTEILSKIISEQFISFTPKIINLIKQSNLWEIALYFKSLTKIIKDIDHNRFEIPKELENYLISEEFKNKIENAEFYEIYRLFKYLKMINFSFSREIWIRNRTIFEAEAFAYRARNDYTYRIFNFYDMFNNTHFNFSLESIEILKKVMRLKSLETIIPYFLEILSNDEFNILLSRFKEEIINISKNYSKFELKRMLRGPIMRQYNTESLNTLQIIFQDRLNEKYFFES